MLGFAWPETAAGQEAGRVAGVVRAEGTGPPVEGAAVRLAGTDVTLAPSYGPHPGGGGRFTRRCYN